MICCKDVGAKRNKDYCRDCENWEGTETHTFDSDSTELEAFTSSLFLRGFDYEKTEEGDKTCITVKWDKDKRFRVTLSAKST